MDSVGSQRRVRVEQARQSLEDAHQRLDEALLAMSPSPDDITLTVPLLTLLWEAVVARRHLRLLERYGEGEIARSLADGAMPTSDRKDSSLN